jgi:transposase-like protein
MLNGTSGQTLKRSGELGTESATATEPNDRSDDKAAKRATPELAASGTGRSNAVEDGEPIEPSAPPSAIETKLAVVLDMAVEGRPHAQVAAYFGVSEHNVRRWEREAMRRGITPLRDREPFEFICESLNNLTEFQANLSSGCTLLPGAPRRDAPAPAG